MWSWCVEAVKETLNLAWTLSGLAIATLTLTGQAQVITFYATVIAYKLGTRGVHYILNKKKVSIINDMWTRLWKEAEDSIDAAEWLTKQISVKVEIDMDYNENENFKSHKLISAAKGWANSLGYKVNIKPNKQIATKAADHHCK